MRLFADVGERAVMVVAVEVARWCFAGPRAFQRRAVYDENVGPAIIVVIENGDAGSRRFDNVFLRVFSAENDWRGEAGSLRHVGEMHDRLGVCFLGLSSGNTRRACGLQRKPSAKPKEAEKPERRKMESHQTPMIARSGPTQINLREDSPKPLVERCADVNMLVFLRTLYRYLSNGIDSRSSADAFPSTECCGAVFLLRCCGDARCAISGFCEDGRSFAGERHLPARYVGATEGRSGFCSRGFRESCAACAEESRGTQLPRLGLARAGRDRFRDRSFPDCGETESRFCAGAHEFLQRAASKRRRECRAPG